MFYAVSLEFDSGIVPALLSWSFRMFNWCLLFQDPHARVLLLLEAGRPNGQQNIRSKSWQVSVFRLPTTSKKASSVAEDAGGLFLTFSSLVMYYENCQTTPKCFFQYTNYAKMSFLHHKMLKGMCFGLSSAAITWILQCSAWGHNPERLFLAFYRLIGIYADAFFLSCKRWWFKTSWGWLPSTPV